MNQALFASIDFNTTLDSEGQASLLFVDDADYEFVSGGAASTNML